VAFVRAGGNEYQISQNLDLLLSIYLSSALGSMYQVEARKQNLRKLNKQAEMDGRVAEQYESTRLELFNKVTAVIISLMPFALCLLCFANDVEIARGPCQRDLVSFAIFRVGALLGLIHARGVT